MRWINKLMIGYHDNLKIYHYPFINPPLTLCGQNSAKIKNDPAAIELNNEAMFLVPFIENPDSSKKAILLPDKAITIDSNYFPGNLNILRFLNQIGQIDKAISTINNLVKTRKPMKL